MRTHVACLGRISVTPRLLGSDRDRVADLAAWWTPSPRGLVLRSGDREAAAAELRTLIGGHFGPGGFVLHGMVVAQSEEGEVFSVTVRRNRVTSRRLWTVEDDGAAETCRVIELDRRRRRESRSRDLPAG
jgi:hypothetical protein